MGLHKEFFVKEVRERERGGENIRLASVLGARRETEGSRRACLPHLEEGHTTIDATRGAS